MILSLLNNSFCVFYLEYILKRQYKVCNIVFFLNLFFVGNFLASWHLVKAIKTFNMASASHDKTNHIDIQGLLQWNPVNTDTKGTCHSVRIIRLSVLSGLSEKKNVTDACL